MILPLTLYNHDDHDLKMAIPGGPNVVGYLLYSVHLKVEIKPVSKI
jgi:hypothetical protein